ncbi:N-acetylmuramoyl-L-alanine amidase, partial [Streptococcus gordonii]
MNEVAYHAGDGYGMGNDSTIAIEICENKDGNYAQAEKNAVKLTARILYDNGLPATAIKMHKDWSGKNCP